MNAPAKELEKMVLDGSICHGNNEVLSWMADNVVVKIDPSGNIKPDKGRSIERIDGIVALIMALDRATHNGGGMSIYETEGLMIL